MNEFGSPGGTHPWCTVNLKTVSLYFRLFRSKALLTNDLELTVPDLYLIRELGNIVMLGCFHAMDNTRWWGRSCPFEWTAERAIIANNVYIRVCNSIHNKKGVPQEISPQTETPGHRRSVGWLSGRNASLLECFLVERSFFGFAHVSKSSICAENLCLFLAEIKLINKESNWSHLEVKVVLILLFEILNKSVADPGFPRGGTSARNVPCKKMNKIGGGQVTSKCVYVDLPLRMWPFDPILRHNTSSDKYFRVFISFFEDRSPFCWATDAPVSVW